MVTPEQRRMNSRLGAYVMHSKNDVMKTTAKARAASAARFEREVDPDGLLEPAERARRAEAARKAHFIRMAQASVKARALKRKEIQ